MTKIPAKTKLQTGFPGTLYFRSQGPPSDLDHQHKSNVNRKAQRRVRNSALSKRSGAGGKRSRPETPLLNWKIEDADDGEGGGVEEIEKDDKAIVKDRSRRRRRGKEVVVSGRKLAAALWRLQFPEAVACGVRSAGRNNGRLGLKPDGSHVGAAILCHQDGRAFDSETKDLEQSPLSFSGAKTRLLHKLDPSFQFPNLAMEGATKWDPMCLKNSDEVYQIYSQINRLGHPVSAVSAVAALEAELEHARLRVNELENECINSKKKYEHFVRKVSEERTVWRSREHEKIRAIIDDVKAELNRERKNRKWMESVNCKLVNELTDAKITAKRFMQDFEKERKAREFFEEVCDELVKDIGDDKAEAEALRRETMKIREEVDEERKMLQMAEVFREERVQMKLIDAKVAVEEKFSQMSKLVADLENYLRSASPTTNVKEMKEALFLQEAAAAINIQDMKEFSYEPSNPDDIFSIFEEIKSAEPNVTEIEQCVSCSPASNGSRLHTVTPKVPLNNREEGVRKDCNGFLDQSGDMEEDDSGWETVSHLEDQDSSNNPEASPPPPKDHPESNASLSASEREENVDGKTPIAENGTVCSVPTKQVRKVSSIARLWRSVANNGESYKIISVEGINGRLSNGRMSNGGLVSPDRGSRRGGVSPTGLLSQQSSPDSGSYRNRGKKGCIPCNAQKHNLKAKLLEARMDTQKVQLRHVLKQKF